MTAYSIYVTPRATREVKALPGHARQRAKRYIDALAGEPRPHHSKALTLPGLTDLEIRRIRFDRWRILYVLAVRSRPPYDYGDLSELLANAPP